MEHAGKHEPQEVGLERPPSPDRVAGDAQAARSRPFPEPKPFLKPPDESASAEERLQYYKLVCGWGSSEDEGDPPRSFEQAAGEREAPGQQEEVDEEEDEDESDENDIDEFDYDFSVATPGQDLAKRMNSAHPNAHQSQAGTSRSAGAVAAKKAIAADANAANRFYSRIHLDALPHALHSTIKETFRKEENQRLRVADKSDRATIEQVLDPRTRMILFKMLNRHVIEEINGCVSTGKEANVYHAVDASGRELAVKIYKTSILVFKDRDKYVSGDFRFRRGYSKHNPRKMVRVWAEKETKNLARLQQAGVLCPQPVMLRSHVLVMTFLGRDGWAAPRLKDASIQQEQAEPLYRQCVEMMRVMFQRAKLVHGDLSEYNILYHRSQLFFIDVSQSVEHDHPHALDFLRLDCENIMNFFSKLGVPVMTTRELFEFVTDITLRDSDIPVFLDQACAKAAGRTLTAEDEVREAVFKQTYIPRSLEGVANWERDHERAKKGETEGIYYQSLTGMNTTLTGPKQGPEILGASDASSDEGMAKDRQTQHKKGGKHAKKPGAAPVIPTNVKLVRGSRREKMKEKAGRNIEQPDSANLQQELSSAPEAMESLHLSKGEGDSDSSTEESDASSGDGSGNSGDDTAPAIGTELSKKERKQLVKQQRREKLANKIPKKMKKRKEKVAKQHAK
eukprot:tig00000980_g6131.t1